MSPSNASKSNVLAGIEIGTSAVKVAMGCPVGDGTFSILGLASAPVKGVVKGEITDMGGARDALHEALEKAERQAGVQVRDVFLAVSGAHIRTVVNAGRTPVQAEDRRIDEDDVITAIRNAKSYNLPPDRRIINSLDRRYLLDGEREIASPAGHPAGSFEAEVLLAYGSVSRLESPCKVVHDVLGYPPEDIAFSPVAACLGALFPEQLEQGTLLVDVGAGVTEYALFAGPGCFHAGQVTVGCNHLANDLAIGLRLSYPKARQLLLDLDKYGSASMQPDGNRRMVEVDTVTAMHRRIPVATIEQVIELRLRELFEVIAADIRAADALPRAGQGAVLCGGGAGISGIEDLASRILGMPVRPAAPARAHLPEGTVDSERYLVPIGLIHYGDFILQMSQQQQNSLVQQIRTDVRRVGSVLKRAFKW